VRRLRPTTSTGGRHGVEIVSLLCSHRDAPSTITTHCRETKIRNETAWRVASAPVAADGGAVVLSNSTDLDERVSVCDRVVVFYRGAVCADLPTSAIPQRTILETMNTGRVQAGAPA
jgi:hypothetical protein